MTNYGRKENGVVAWRPDPIDEAVKKRQKGQRGAE